METKIQNVYKHFNSDNFSSFCPFQKKKEIMTIQMLIIVIMIFICFVHFSHKSINLFLHSQELSLKTKDVMEIHKDKR